MDCAFSDTHQPGTQWNLLYPEGQPEIAKCYVETEIINGKVEKKTRIVCEHTYGRHMSVLNLTLGVKCFRFFLSSRFRFSFY